MNKAHYDELTRIAKELRASGHPTQVAKAIFIEAGFFEMLELAFKEVHEAGLKSSAILDAYAQLVLLEPVSRLIANEKRPLVRALLLSAARETFIKTFDELANHAITN